MSKSTQVLTIDPPNELSFKGPFNDVVTTYLKLSNPSDRQVCFKVKTTAPKQYCVRPNSGLIPSGGNINVAVMLQPMESTDPERTKHKFMVQSAFVPEGEVSLDAIWRNADPIDLMDSKLRVVFDSPQMQDSNVSTEVPLKSSVLECNFESELEEKNRLRTKLTNLELENNDLRVQLGARKQRLQSAGSELTPLSNLTPLQVLLVLLAVLLVGLILGKLF